MRSIAKFIFIAIGGLLLLMVLGMLISAIFGIHPERIKTVNLIYEWTFYRVIFYCIVIFSWPLLCNLAIRLKIKDQDLTEEEIEKKNKKRQKDLQYMKSQRWKLFLLFVFFEVVIVHQFGL